MSSSENKTSLINSTYKLINTYVKTESFEFSKVSSCVQFNTLCWVAREPIKNVSLVSKSFSIFSVFKLSVLLNESIKCSDEARFYEYILPSDCTCKVYILVSL